MATIIYTKNTSSGIEDQNDLVESSVRILIEHENDRMSAEGGICDALFNVEDSQKYAETLVNHTDLGVFRATAEGEGAESLTAEEKARKVVEHIQFMGEFGISANMLEDAGYGIAADGRRLVKSFVRSYYRTRNMIAEAAIINGGEKSVEFNNATVDLCTADGLPLFSKDHTYGDSKVAQSNKYYKAKAEGETISAALIEQYLGELTVKMRNMKDENGMTLGYEADTVLIPGNNPALESAVRKAVLSLNTCGSDLNDVNLQYGKWKIIVLPDWQSADKDQFIVMSSEANRELGGNMFFNRVPLTVKSWEDHHTGNRMWNGRCRFGIGFGSYKHMIYFTSVANGETPEDATEL